ncbi:DUF6504 family protein [Nocardioides daphniae]|nr:DUF6504 family protein [Nocardioides daphniae]QCC77009.1 hypothetical protein E2C04_06885 [Nocardioides daphniae]
MRRYDDPVEVRRGQVAGQGSEQSLEAPEQFLWHGRVWKVRSVVARWVETGPWWQSSRARSVIGAEVGEADHLPHQRDWDELEGDLLAEREFWRVEAGRPVAREPQEGPTSGVFDLSYDAIDGRWQLVGCLD